MKLLNKAWLFYILAFVLLMSLPVWFYLISSGPYYGRSVSSPAPDFTLQDTQQTPHQLSQHLGKFVFLYFGYLNCDDVCHNQIGVLFNINHQTENKDLDFIFVTLDPERDSATQLNDYFNQFGPNFTALTGKNIQQIQQVAVSYKEFFFADSNTKTNLDYEISHSGNIFLIDPNGQLRIIYPNSFLRYDDMIADINLLRTEFSLKGMAQ